MKQTSTYRNARFLATGAARRVDKVIAGSSRGLEEVFKSRVAAT
jgi:hypothetical protein